jgi:hypothetical protein
MKAVSTTDYDRSKPTGECITYVGNMITNNVRFTHEITSRIAMAKTSFNEKKTLFNGKLDLNLRKKLLKCFI